MALCSMCGLAPRANGSHSYCGPCRNLRHRLWRDTHPPSEEERRKNIVRATARVYKRRGKLISQPCEKCGAEAQMHHDDYSKPLAVRWLCAPCHRAHHWAAA